MKVRMREEEATPPHCPRVAAPDAFKQRMAATPKSTVEVHFRKCIAAGLHQVIILTLNLLLGIALADPTLTNTFIACFEPNRKQLRGGVLFPGSAWTYISVQYNSSNRYVTRFAQSDCAIHTELAGFRTHDHHQVPTAVVVLLSDGTARHLYSWLL